MRIPRFSAHMRETLVKGEQLTDEHIQLAQQLLKKQFQAHPSLTSWLWFIGYYLREDEEGDELNPPILYVDVPAVQQQRGVLDCGVFAIAFAVHLALGDDVTS